MDVAAVRPWKGVKRAAERHGVYGIETCKATAQESRNSSTMSARAAKINERRT